MSIVVLAPSASWLYMEKKKKSSYSFLGNFVLLSTAWNKSAGSVGPGFTEVPLNAWACFTDSSSKLKCSGIHWDIAPVQTQHQLCRTENGHDCSAQWIELKLIYLTSTPLDELHYISTYIWTIASCLAQTHKLEILCFICLYYVYHYLIILTLPFFYS